MKHPLSYYLSDPERRRALVLRMARVRLPDHQIAFTLGITEIDLSNEFADSLKQEKILAHFEILETLYVLAKSGKHPSATIHWLNTFGDESTQKPKPPAKVPLYPKPYIPPECVKVQGPDGTLYDGPIPYKPQPRAEN